MTPRDKREFAALMAALGDYYGRELSDAVIGMYWQGLERYDIAAVREALNRHMHNPDTGQFMPKIADISRMLAGTTQDAALVAWAKVDQAVRRIGSYADVVFDDALIHRVLHDMGGWMALGTKNEDEWPFVAKEFENRYRGYRMRSERPEYPPVLIGIAGAHNRNGNHALQPPMLIGDQAKAQAVMHGGTDRPLIGFTSAMNLSAALSLVDDSVVNAA
jgi:hypothetical protein